MYMNQFTIQKGRPYVSLEILLFVLVMHTHAFQIKDPHVERCGFSVYVEVSILSLARWLTSALELSYSVVNLVVNLIITECCAGIIGERSEPT